MVSVASRRLFQLNSTRVIANKIAPVNFLRTFTSTHKLSFSTDPDVTTPPSKLTLYQYQICPFCNKTKALLNYASINYETVEVNPLTKAELKPWSGSYRKVPIALMDGKQHNGSDDILSALLDDDDIASKLLNKWQASSSINSDEKDSSEAMTMDKFRNDPSLTEWNEFAEMLAKILYPNICRSLSDSYDAFNYVNDVNEFSIMQKISVRAIGSVAMFLAASKIKKKLNIEDERQALNEALDELEEKGLEMGKKIFISGLEHPNMADITIFGTLRSIEHLSTFREVMENRDSKIAQNWYNKITSEIPLV